MSASTRRAALGAILAAPLASVPVVAAPSISADEAGLLAIGPQLVRLLDEHDRAWAPVHAFYEAYDRVRSKGIVRNWAYDEALPEWKAYIAARRPADEISERAEALYEPFENVPLRTLPAILLRHRYGMSFEAFREDALIDLDRLWREGVLCA